MPRCFISGQSWQTTGLKLVENNFTFRNSPNPNPMEVRREWRSNSLVKWLKYCTYNYGLLLCFSCEIHSQRTVLSAKFTRAHLQSGCNSTALYLYTSTHAVTLLPTACVTPFASTLIYQMCKQNERHTGMRFIQQIEIKRTLTQERVKPMHSTAHMCAVRCIWTLQRHKR